ncbi:uncharacterized protein LOC101949456 isoform X3 [Chrysemys picta bellii]|uniref:uncharacterized protein LOC101949456 isoform X3 n=1 Tax=Chrysemys picta bellii TaxID=8478 RepID=UPI0032B10D33
MLQLAVNGMQNVSPACSTHSNAGGKKLEDQGLTASPAIMEGPVPPCDPFLSDMATLHWLPGCLGLFVVTLLVGSPIPVASSDVRSCPCTQGCCPAGWYQYRDSCYYPVTATKGWWKAEGQLEGEGSWHWTDGSAWHYHNFGNGKPDRITAETFVASWKLDQDAITWDNYEASLEFMSVCKRSLD